jgi:lipopolysaccharide transport system ATP-binding protein
MSSDSPAIQVENLSKCYQIYERPSDRLKSFIMPRVRRLAGQPLKAYCREFWALRGVSFDVGRGETVGILGRNGAGKSTLLQLICGTLSPTNGSVVTRGRVAALLELGSGFNPDFTGRDNVYMNAALLGLTREETDARYDAIVDFADIGSFVDQPVKTYSSGMMVRLAFAVQAQVEPDILIVDEALAVGDAKFQARCFERLRQLKDNGTSILLVTHSTEQIVTHCSRAILLSDGGVLDSGEPRRVANRYLDLLFGREHTVRLAPSSEKSKAADLQTAHAAFPLSSSEDKFALHPAYNPHEYRWGDGSASILDFYLAADETLYPSVISSGQLIRLGVSLRFQNDLVRPILGVTVKTKEGVTVYGANSETLDAQELKALGQSATVVAVEMTFTCRLAQGDYFISLGIATREGEEIVPHDRRYDSIHLHVGPVAQFFGLADLDLSFRKITASS